MIQSPPWVDEYFKSKDTKTPKFLNKLELRKYLESWCYNVGIDSDVEMTVINAMGETHSLIDWFGTSYVQYDDEYAVQVIRKIAEASPPDDEDE